MRTVSLVLGLLGAVAAFVAALFAGAAGAVGGAFGMHHAGEVGWLAISAWGASILGLIAAILVLSRPTTAAWLLLIAMAWIVISVSAFGVPAGVLFALSAVFAFFARRQHPAAKPPVHSA